MSLPKPRDGEALGFSVYSRVSSGITMGIREHIVWSSIRQLCASGSADLVLSDTYGIKNKKKRSTIISNLKVYINQASDFYVSASQANINTSPLFYYYCFLNLAKAVCEIRYPGFHKRPESYNHGLSWHPSSKYIVDMWQETVNISTRGVWHVLWEAITNKPCSATNPTILKISDLFSICLGISTEYLRTYGKDSCTIELVNPNIVFDDNKEECWLALSASRDDLRDLKLSRHNFLDLISDGNDWYRQVKSDNNDLWTFELKNPKSVKLHEKDPLFILLEHEINTMNPFVHPGINDFIYNITVQTRFPLKLRQLIVLYTLIFWLGSLVRYDPQSVADLKESAFWILIDGFINQCCLQLLQLFEWELYRAQTFLTTV